MNDPWRQQTEPLIRDLQRAFDNDTEAWWENGRRRHSNGSLQASELLSEPRYATHGQRSPVYDAYATGAVSIRLSQEHLWGAFDSILSRSMFSSFALARCSLEAAARGYWLLDPDIRVEQRLLRESQYYARCLAEVRKMMNAAPQSALSGDVRRIAAHEKANLDWARFHNLTQVTSKAKFAKESIGFTDLVSDFLRDMPEGDKIAPMVYRWLSGTVHSNPVVLAEFGQRASFRSDEENVLQMGASSGTVWFPIWLAARGLQMALVRLANVNSWESPDYFLGPVVTRIGQIVQSDIESTKEQIDRPTVYNEFLRNTNRD